MRAENARLRDELAELQQANTALRAQVETTQIFQERLKALHEIGIVLARAESLDDLCGAAVKLGRERLGFDRIGIWLFSDDHQYLNGSFGTDESGNLRDERHIRRPTDPHILSAEIISRQRPVRVFTNTPLFNDRSEIVGSGWSAIAGLWDGDRVIGTLDVDNLLCGRPLEPHQEDLLVLFSAMLGNLYTRKLMESENQRLYREARRQAEEAETLRRASAAVTATLSLPETIDRILEQLNLVVPYDSASVQLREGQESVIVGGRGFPDLSTILGWRFSLHEDNPTRVVYELRRAYTLGDAQEAYPVMRHPPHAHIRSWMGVPLIIHDDLIGMISLDSVELDHFTPHHADLVEAFATQVAIAIENARLFESARELAITDALTGLYNRGYLFDLARREHALMERTGNPLGVIMLDLDHFKRVNDTYGHAIGDQVLCEAARRCRAAVRAADVVARYGGEEFAIVLPGADGPQTLDVAERVRQCIASTPFDAGGSALWITASLGIATAAPGTLPSLDALFQLADQRLYMAKQGGRDRVVGSGAGWPE